MPKISCTIITRNEADRIELCLRAVAGIADEIVVIDSGSTDGTQDICTTQGARVIHNDWPGFGPQKRFAEDSASHDWILNLDADEVLSNTLRNEIISWKKQEKTDIYGYKFKQITVYPGKAKPRPLADYHHYVRLYNKTRMRFRDSLTHDEVESGSHKVGRFRGHCLHYSYRSLEHLAAKLDSYTSLQAREIRKPLWQLYARLPFEYPLLFLRYYLSRRHITGGLYGLKAAHVIAKGRAARISKFIRKKRKI